MTKEAYIASLYSASSKESKSCLKPRLQESGSVKEDLDASNSHQFTDMRQLTDQLNALAISEQSEKQDVDQADGTPSEESKGQTRGATIVTVSQETAGDD